MEAMHVPQALNWKAGSVAMGMGEAARAAALACKRSRAVFRSLSATAAGWGWGCCAARAVADTNAVASLRRVSFMDHLGGGGGAWPLPVSASMAAFCMTERGALSPVQISN